jgi:energy-coupling factor transporter ATP-binding protein EcfA2
MSDASTPQDLPPAYFLSLSLENVRCFGPEQTLDLSNEEGGPAQWTVLLGNNGTGKTTVLQAIAAMEPGSLNGDTSRKAGVLPRWVWDVGVDSTWDVVRSNMVEESRPQKSPARIETDFFIGSKLRASNGGRRVEGFNCQKFEDVAPSAIKPQNINHLVGRTSCFGYGASRRMSEGALEKKDDDSEYGLFLSEVDLPNVEEWLLQTDYAAKSGKPKAERRLRQIETILADPDSGILPDVDALRFAEQKGDTAPPRVEFHTPYGWVTVDELSLGYRTMIAWVVDLARRLFERYPESDNPLAEPAVCLVDEIDLHLHPKWQRKIIDFLSERFPNTQFVVTAHSPLVVQAAQDANVAVLRRKENPGGDDYVVIDNDPARIRNWRIDQILTSDLFDLDSARPPQIEELWDERKRLLGQDELSDADEQRLQEIEEKIGDLPSGETKEQRDAMAFIKRVGDRLEREGQSS